MKRIIYSLVMMFALGGIFTSCIDNVEPDGVEAMREAHAKYLLACAALVEADATVQEAQAAYIDAQADAIKAETEFQRIVNQIKEINLAMKKAESEAEIAKYQAEKDSILNAWEVQKLKDQEALAKAQVELEQALKEIELGKLELSDAEKGYIERITDAYADAASTYNYELGEYLDAYEEAVTDAAIADATYETFEAKMDLKLEVEKAKKARLQEIADLMLKIKDEYISVWAEELEAINDSIESYRPRLVELATEKAYIIANQFPELEAKYLADSAAAAATRDAALDELTPVEKPSAEFAKKYNLPEFSNIGDIVTVFEVGVNGIIKPDANDGTPYSTIGFEDPYVAPYNDTLIVSVPELNAAVADYIMNANDTMVGFNNLVKLIEAPYAYDFSDFTEEQKAASLTYRDSLDTLYNAIIKRLGASKNYKKTYEALHDAWYAKAVRPYEIIDSLKDLWVSPGKKDLIKSVTTPVAGYTDDAYDHKIFYCENAKDSAEFINYLNEFGAAINAVDPDNELKCQFYYTSIHPVTAYYIKDSLHFKDAKLSGLTLSGSNTTLTNINIFKVSPYDNKGRAAYGNVTPVITEYIDGLQNLVRSFNGWYSTTDFTGIQSSVKDIDPDVRNYASTSYLPWAKLPATYKGTEAEAEANALYRWLEDCYIYYGEVGRQSDAFAAENGEYLGFIYETFKNVDKNYLAVFFDEAFEPEWNSDYSELENLGFGIQYDDGNGSPIDVFSLVYYNNWFLLDEENWGEAEWENTLVFKLFAAEEFYAQMSDVTRLDRWNAIKAIIAQVEADMNAFIEDYNAENADYLAYAKAAKAITDTYNKALKAAKKEFADACAALIDPIDEEIAAIEAEIFNLQGLYNQLESIYEAAVKLEYTGSLAQYYALFTDEPGPDLTSIELANKLPDQDEEDFDLRYLAYKLYQYVDQVYDAIHRCETEIARIESYRSLREDADYQALLKEYNEGYLKMLKEVVDDAEFWKDFYKSKYDALIAIYKAEI